jgi:hypothetical protein
LSEAAGLLSSLLPDLISGLASIHDLPDYAYFDHSIHVHKGVARATCHGQVNEMPLTWKTNALYMRWCLDCASRIRK